VGNHGRLDQQHRLAARLLRVAVDLEDHAEQAEPRKVHASGLRIGADHRHKLRGASRDRIHGCGIGLDAQSFCVFLPVNAKRLFSARIGSDSGFSIFGRD